MPTWTPDASSWASGTALSGQAPDGGILLGGITRASGVAQAAGNVSLRYQVAHTDPANVLVTSRVLVNGVEQAFDDVENAGWDIPPTPDSLSLTQTVAVTPGDHIVVEIATRDATNPDNATNIITPAAGVAPLLRYTDFRLPDSGRTEKYTAVFWYVAGQIQPSDWANHLANGAGMTVDGDWDGDGNWTPPADLTNYRGRWISSFPLGYEIGDKVSRYSTGTWERTGAKTAPESSSFNPANWTNIGNEPGESSGQRCIRPNDGSIQQFGNGPKLPIGSLGIGRGWPWPTMNADGSLLFETPPSGSIFNWLNHRLLYVQGSPTDDAATNAKAWIPLATGDKRFQPELTTREAQFLVSFEGDWTSTNGLKLILEQYSDAKPPNWVGDQQCQMCIYAGWSGTFGQLGIYAGHRGSTDDRNSATNGYTFSLNGFNVGIQNIIPGDPTGKLIRFRVRRRPDFRGTDAIFQIWADVGNTGVESLVYDGSGISNAVDWSPVNDNDTTPAQFMTFGNYLSNPDQGTTRYLWFIDYLVE